MKILLVEHRDIFTQHPRGGEKSMKAIVAWMVRAGHEVDMVPWRSCPSSTDADIVLSWGKGAIPAMECARESHRPFIMFVRFWRNVAPLPAGDLMSRPVDHYAAATFFPLYDYASAIITNSEYAKKVIERWHPAADGKVHVSYVPVTGEFQDVGHFTGKVLVFTPEIYGEVNLVDYLSNEFPGELFLFVNGIDDLDTMKLAYRKTNVECCAYMPPERVWIQAKVVLVPVYHNDICGTRRITIEAFQHGVPVLAMDRCGMSEKVPRDMLISPRGDYEEWKHKLSDLTNRYDHYEQLAKEAWDAYETEKELQKVEGLITSIAESWSWGRTAADQQPYTT